MQQLGEFITNHLIMVSIFTILLVVLIKTLITDLTQKGSNINTTEATQLINREDAIVIDIRDKGEFEGGHIINALNIPFNDIKTQADKLAKYKEQPVIICCRSGLTAGSAISPVKAAGVERVYRLKGGIDSWRAANLPLTS